MLMVGEDGENISLLINLARWHLATGRDFAAQPMPRPEFEFLNSFTHKKTKTFFPFPLSSDDMLGHRRERCVHALGNVSFKVDRDTDSIGSHDDASGNVRNCDNPPTLMNLHFHCTIHGQVGTNEHSTEWWSWGDEYAAGQQPQGHYSEGGRYLPTKVSTLLNILGIFLCLFCIYLQNLQLIRTHTTLYLFHILHRVKLIWSPASNH